MEKVTKGRPVASKVLANNPGAAQPKAVVNAPPRVKDSGAFAAGVTSAGLHPDLSAERQKATFERIFALGKQVAAKGETPVIVIDHRLTGLDDRPIIKKGLQQLGQDANIDELKDVEASLANGTLKFLPGYTEQASDHWRDLHPELVAKYPDALGPRGSRLNINFMGFSSREANATAGLAELEARWKLETGGKGKIIFAGAGTGTAEDFASVYRRPKEEGGAGLENPDVRHGAPAPSPEATARAQKLLVEYTQSHPGEDPVGLDRDSSGKAGWIETIESEGTNTVVAFIDDRAHNRLGAIGAAKLGKEMIAVKSLAPGLSYSQNDNGTELAISTFSPNPQPA